LVGPFNTSFRAGPAVSLSLIFVECPVEVKPLEYEAAANAYWSRAGPDVPLECFAFDSQVGDRLCVGKAALDDRRFAFLATAPGPAWLVFLEYLYGHNQAASKPCSRSSRSDPFDGDVRLP
jgi:hypothetical protein